MLDSFQYDKYHYQILTKFSIVEVIKKCDTNFQINQIEMFQDKFQLSLTQLVIMDSKRWMYIIKDKPMILHILINYGFIIYTVHVPVCKEPEPPKINWADKDVQVINTIFTKVTELNLPPLKAERHCKIWTSTEKEQFQKEIDTLIHLIALNHQRSYGSIACRVRDHFEWKGDRGDSCGR